MGNLLSLGAVIQYNLETYAPLDIAPAIDVVNADILLRFVRNKHHRSEVDF